MNNRGVSLIELMVVVAIIGILVVALAFSYQGWQGRYKVEGQTRTIYTDLMYARSQAMTRGLDYFVVFQPSLKRYAIIEDTNNNGVPNPGAGDTILPTFPKTVEYDFTWSGVNQLLFDRKGLIRWDRNGDGIEETSDVIRLTTTVNSDYDCIMVFQTRINTGKWNTTTGVCDVK